MLDMIQIGPDILPPEAYNLDMSCANSFTPSYHDTYNCDQYGKSWRNAYTTRAVTDDLAARHVEIVFGGFNLVDGGAVPWWRMQSHSLLPDGDRGIGDCSNPVKSIYTISAGMSPRPSRGPRAC